jgi:hypothetical protein
MNHTHFSSDAGTTGLIVTGVRSGLGLSPPLEKQSSLSTWSLEYEVKYKRGSQIFTPDTVAVVQDLNDYITKYILNASWEQAKVLCSQNIYSIL